MADNPIKRKYNFIDAELYMITSNLCNRLARDISEFMVFGLTAQDIENLKTLNDSFGILSPDGSILADIMLANEDKNILRNKLLESIRNMAMWVKLKWGTDSVNYKRLDLKNPSQLNDDLLLVTGRNFHAKMTEFQPDLETLGLTQAILDDFENLNSQFENALNAFTDSKVIRDQKTTERIVKGNELYDVVTKYCSLAKRIYEKTNPAKYNDYLIYRGKNKKKKKEEENHE
jgi:hypothetical protein